MLPIPVMASDGFLRKCLFHVSLFICLVFAAVLTLYAASGPAWAIQKHSLETSSSHDTGEHAKAPHAKPKLEIKSGDEHKTAHGAGDAHGATDHGAADHGDSHGAAAGGHGDSHAAADHGAEHVSPGHEDDEHGAHAGHHGPPLPEISDIPGVTFVEVLIELMNAELRGRLFGWRPNDITVGQITDDVNEFQLGALEAIRHATRVLKEDFSRLGEADAYDRDLEDALNLLMNKATLFWFPSAENSYSEAIEHLERYKEKLKTGQRSFFYRVDSVKKFCAVFEDFLGNINKELIRGGVSWMKVDNSFYYAKGAAHVLYELLRVMRVGFEQQLIVMDAVDFVDVILHELHVAEEINPWIILDGPLDGWTANHRANLNAPLSEVTHLLGIISRLQ